MEEIERSQREQHQRVARHPIRQATPWRTVEVLLHGHGPDIAGAALVEMSRGAMMDRMLPSPMIVRREGQRAGDQTDEVIGPARGEIRAMAAVVEDNEEPHHERAREIRYQSSK
jgi:hypothetical protein